jgi:hypothetical protein
MGVLSFVPAARAGNLISDGGLDQVPADGSLPPSMQVSNQPDGDTPAPIISVSTTAPAGASHSICIQRFGFRGPARVKLGAPIAIQAGHRYYFSCQTKWTNGTAGLSFDFLDAQHHAQRAAPVDIMSTVPGMNFHANAASIAWALALLPDGFNRLDVSFTAPPDASGVTASLDFGTSSGTAWYADFHLVPLD